MKSAFSDKEWELLGSRFLFLFQRAFELDLLKEQGIIDQNKKHVIDSILNVDDEHLVPIEKTWLYQITTQIPKGNEEVSFLDGLASVDTILQVCEEGLQDQECMKDCSITDGALLLRNYCILRDTVRLYKDPSLLQYVSEDLDVDELVMKK